MWKIIIALRQRYTKIALIIFRRTIRNEKKKISPFISSDTSEDPPRDKKSPRPYIPTKRTILRIVLFFFISRLTTLYTRKVTSILFFDTTGPEVNQNFMHAGR